MMNKYTYYKIIQGNYGYGWNDEDAHETDSSGYMPQPARAALKENIRLYRENGGGVYRIVKRRELSR
jgi:hypothetical protein